MYLHEPSSVSETVTLAYCRYVLAFSGLMGLIFQGFHYMTPGKPGIGDDASFFFFCLFCKRVLSVVS